MKLHRFLGEYSFGSKRLYIADRDLLRQIKSVLRLGKGNEIILSDGNGRDARAAIIGFGRDGIDVEIIDVERNLSEPHSSVVLYCSVLKKENFEYVVQKATEVGVREIVPLVTERTVKLSVNKARIAKIIREAAEQSGRAFVPAVEAPVEFARALDGAKNNDLNLFYDPDGETLQRPVHAGRIGVFIGPEGGWTEDERKLARMQNFIVVRLGKLTLRAETAAIIASYLAAMS